MRWKPLDRLPLAQRLLLLLVPTLLLLSLAELRVTAQDVQRAADTAYDRSLLGALKAIDANVSTESGGLSVELPYRMFEFFELTASGPVHYRVATADGLVELGSADLPAAPQPLRPGVPVFYDGRYFGEPVRLVAYTRELDRPTGESPARQLVIQVAESMQARSEFRRLFVRRAAIANGVFLLLTVASAALAVMLVLRPLARVSEAIAGRSPSELGPLDAAKLPPDLRPPIAAMNRHMQRIAELLRQQRDFIDAASHQLRTHLTTLRMQVEFARREPDPAQVGEALAALETELQRATRSTNQLLALARSDSAQLQPAPFEVEGLLQDVARQFLPAARQAGVDLGVDCAPQQAVADAGLLREALANLVANAIAYGGGAPVTLSAAQDAFGCSIAVEDSGPGLAPELQQGAGARFLRPAGARPGGSGLGLAIARSVAARHGGGLRLEPGAGGRGLRAALWWPRAAPEEPAG
ncbi:sensor histidine kinase [Ramlibacter alkalitolerans]|uniref:histidine kinase n=1 Tax=Ramlibacter alkalitolerans TaxID=2039631 RepID=A0ABS1JMC6_9BURK|nr:sensor histidine kinase [Ramlibacter alkalitolerans]MBL0425364.1 sensor histidine kinase [Ramlibacter alkalitolerans]